MSSPPADPPSVTLDNCDREPIHVPGAIQPHGALLAFDAQGRVAWRSDNAEAVLGRGAPAPGAVLDPSSGGFAAGAQLLAPLVGPRAVANGVAEELELTLAGRRFDLVVHGNGRYTIAEFEPRPDDGGRAASFAGLAHAAMGRLRRQRTVQDLLETAVAEVRALTGFDRVMAYRFRHDASGDIVAEARREELEPFLHRRYPASDIPAQARRLYAINTIRQIVDVRAQPVPLRGQGVEPLDLSGSVLRAVSPIHIEYLGNMGVAASMSVSIVIHGQLWGMLACHHLAPRLVPYPVRMACDVLGQLLASNVQTLLAAERSRHLGDASALRVRLIEAMVHADGTLGALKPFVAELQSAFGAEALVACEGTECHVGGELPAAAAHELLQWLRVQGSTDGLVAVSRMADLPAPLAATLGPWCGLLALRTDEQASDWLVLLRREQVETIAWGGRPEKVWASGPNGPRLTPRGSFEVWRETVRGTTVPWSATELEMARELRLELVRASSARQAQLGRARDQLMAMLGHDLRNPLQTITMASKLLEQGADGAQLGQRIGRSSSRMARLISDVLDVSRLQSGMGLGVNPHRTDLVRLVREVAGAARLAHPGLAFELDLPAERFALMDEDRVAQLLDNLLGNARQHGEPGHPIRVSVHEADGQVQLSVANRAPAIAPDLAAQLFNPYKRQSLDRASNRGGLGLGLHIASEIARGHGGTLVYDYRDPYVVFTFAFPG